LPPAAEVQITHGLFPFGAKPVENIERVPVVAVE